MARIAMKIAYDGTAFHGQARQPGLRTVEGEIVRVLRRARVIHDERIARFQSASRTDRGVSALGNVVAFNTHFPATAAVRAFNAKARGVWAWAAASVPEAFNARRARSRWYRYFLSSDHDPERLSVALRAYVGRHDFHNFTRDRARTIVQIDEAAASLESGSVVLDFRAPSFRWNLVRRLVAAALQVASDVVTLRDLENALVATARVDFGLAPPEPLVLMDVLYDVGFEPVRDRTTVERVRRILEERRRDARFHELLADRFPREEGPR